MSTLSPQSSPNIPSQTHLQYLRETIKQAQKSPPKPTNFRVGCVIVSYPLQSSSTSSTSTPELDTTKSPSILSTGYTLEIATPETANTHAEQVALYKLSNDTNTTTTPQPDQASSSSSSPSSYIILYTSLEPCSKRLSGNTSCVERIISTTTTTTNNTRTNTPKINKVIFGAKEPNTFIQDSKSCQILTTADVSWEYLPEYQDEILEVAMTGHRPPQDQDQDQDQTAQAGSTDPAKGEGGGDEKTRASISKSEELESKKKATNVDDITEEERKRQAQMPRNPKKRMMEVPPEELGGQ